MHWQQAQKTYLNTLLLYSRVGLVTDLDGTLSHIVQQPDLATVTEANLGHLAALQKLLPLVAVISGRSAADIYARVNLPGLQYIGNHGLERWVDGAVIAAPAVSPHLRSIRNAARSLTILRTPGILVEDKGLTISVHYRKTADPVKTAEEIRPVLQKTATDFNLALFEGRMVFELRPPVARDKGTAFAELVQEYALDAAIFLGDDTTDVPALQTARRLRKNGTCYAIGLGVISAESPTAVRENADLYADGVIDVEAFLSWLAAVCQSSAI